MNGSTGIQPTVELATTNGNGFYPMYNGGAFGNAFGGDGIWAIVLLALLFGNNGWGGFGGNGFNNVATTDYISSEFTQRDVNNGFQNTNNLVSSGFADNATNICNLRSDVLTGNMAIQNSILDSKYADLINAKDTQRDILMQTTELENQASINALQAQSKLDSCCCELRAQGLENTQRILDAINNNTIQDLRDKLATANNQLSDQAVISAVLPRSVPAYINASPYQSIYNPYNFGYGFNNII
jgi:hypothetical protein